MDDVQDPEVTATEGPADGEPGHSPQEPPPRYVVGMGASAGGLEALEAFFDNVPLGMGMAFVIVQHLSPDFRSMMDELLARHTRLPIQLVEDGMPVRADHVYLIPPKKEMIISGGRLLLSEKERQQEFPLPIDMFFRSLAQDCGARAVAIVLSGGGSDGSRGVRDIHDAGGLVIVQDTATAQFDGMPRTARDAGVAHFVLPPQEMPNVLVEHAARTGRVRATVSAAADGTKLEGVAVLYQMLEREFGLDFTLYKPSTITRRIERRLGLARVLDIEQYVERLRSEREQLDVLYRDLLIGVTRFFRNEEAFAKLEDKVLPELFKREPRSAPLRVWVPGCATGEEAYSLAISFHETAKRLGDRSVKIFATDVHPGSLERAARAMYDEEAVSHVSPERLERYFVRHGSSYQVAPEVRQTVVFAAHNLIKDAPFTRVDLVSCRNLLIYLQPSAQQKALALFHFALHRGGILFLGPSESPGQLAHDFETIDKHWRLYRKFSDARIPVAPRFQPTKAQALAAPSVAPQSTRYSLTQLLGTYDSLLDKFMPPSLLVTEQGELVHAFGGASKFLSPHEGRQGLNVLELVHPEVRAVLVGGLRRAFLEPTAIAYKGIRIAAGDVTAKYRITIGRVAGKGPGAAHALVSFERLDSGPVETAPIPESEVNLERVSHEQLTELQAELVATKENLQSAIEELQTSNEELQAANEELQASNEELQSTNEELQSVNEELYTVNAEYQRKIGELTELMNDMDNLMSSTDVGTIFLDAQLKIRRFTPQIAETFKLVVHDIGRPIDTFAHTMHHAALIDDIKRCLSEGQRVERELRDVQGKSFFLRLLPYRAKGKIDGVVLTLIDVSGLKAAEDALFHERYLLNSLLGNIPDAIYFKDVRGRFIRANPAMLSRLGLSSEPAAVGKTAFELLDERCAHAMIAADEAVLRTGAAQLDHLEVRTIPKDDEAWDRVTRLPLNGSDGQVVGMIGIFRDVTSQKHAEEKLRDQMRRRDQFLAMLSHELRNPLSAIVTSTELLKSGGAATPETRSPVLAVLDRQSMQMARLLDDLLEVSRVTQNKIQLRKRRIDLRSAIKEAAAAVRPAMEARGMVFTVEVDDAPIYLDGDPERLEQVQTNLLTNSMKYTQRGGHVTLRASREEDCAVVRVVDDGAGIPKEMLESVFELFVQSRQTLARAEGGLGLGLTLVRSLVAMHGGTVSAHSQGPGEGSEFVIRLPLAEVQEVDPVSVAPRPRATGKGARVAIVEDNADSLEILCAFLQKMGYECQSANNGVAGLELINEMRPQLAIIDLGLPEMDGLELARQLRSDPRHTDLYLVALTGYGQPADRARAKAAGFDEHLVKPVRVEQLLKRLSLQVDERQDDAVN